MQQNLFTRRSYLLSARLLFTMALAVGMLALLLALLAQLTQAQTPWTDGQDADGVLGQSDFDSSASDTTSSTMDNPIAIAVDPTSGKVFVAEWNNNRVLRFDSVAAATNGAAAEAVLGQSDFDSSASGTTSRTMHHPSGLYVDSTGTLWVSEFDNSRVLWFNEAISKTDGAAADGVLGQENFTSGAINRTGKVTNVLTNTLCQPAGLYVDITGTLWIADVNNNRVLRFTNAVSKSNGAPADGVLGQDYFTSSVAAATQSGMEGVYGVVGDSSGRLFVADLANSRVLRFDGAAAKANGADADGVLGQNDFTSNVTATTQTGMHGPRGVALDDSGRLYVSEENNHRVLVFEAAATITNGAPADNVLGQADFDSGSANQGSIVAVNTISNPRQIFFDNATQRLWVADRGNNRVLRFGFPNLRVIKSVVGAGGDTAGLPLGSVVTYTIVLSNSGEGVASGVVMTDELPDGVSFGGWLQQGSALLPPPSGDTINWGPYDIQADDEYTIRFTATITTATAFVGKTISNTAWFTSGSAGSGSNEASFTVNAAPTADAGSDQTVDLGDTVTLDGSGSSDPDSDALTYGWRQTGGTSVTLSDSGAVSPTFTAPAGPLTFTLTVTDVHGLSDATPDEVVVTIRNVAPVAHAGSDQAVDYSDTVTLDGSGSSDANGDALTYGWRQTGGTTVTLSSSGAVSPTFTAPSVADVLTFTLTVTDVHGLADATPDEVVITVKALPVLQVIKSVAGAGGSTADLPLSSVVTYTIVFSNSGHAAASGVVMTDELPLGVTFGGWLEQGSALLPDPPGDTLTWGPYDVPANDEYTIRFTATITTASAFAGETVSNTAYVTATNADPDSDEASFTIAPANTAPTISDILAKETYINTPIVIPFTIGDAETAAGDLTLSAESSNTTLVPILNIVFGGSGANRTVTITPATNLTGTSTITITVSDGTDTDRDDFVLTVVKHRIYLPLVFKN